MLLARTLPKLQQSAKNVSFNTRYSSLAFASPLHTSLFPICRSKHTTAGKTMRKFTERGFGTRAVMTAIVSNGFIAATKIAGFLYTGSGSMFSEAVHSLADTANQVLLYFGIRRSLRPPTPEHPYGHGQEQFVWSLISALGIFFVGSGGSIYHGITTLLNPHPLESIHVAAVVLGISLIVEGASFAVALYECQRGAKAVGMPLIEYVVKGVDVTNTAVLLEDIVAISGVGIASLCIALTLHTGQVWWDSLGAISVGGLLSAVALLLVQKNKEALIGATISADQNFRITNTLATDPTIRDIHDVKALRMGPDVLRYKAEIAFNGEEIAKRALLRKNVDIKALYTELNSPEKLEKYLLSFGDDAVDQLGFEVDRIEEEVKKKIPEMKFVHVDLETHYRGETKKSSSS